MFTLLLAPSAVAKTGWGLRPALTRQRAEKKRQFELKEALIAKGIDEDLFIDKTPAKKASGTQDVWSDGMRLHLYGKTKIARL